MDLASLIRNVPDFPKQGVQFKDITTLLQHGSAFKFIIDGWRDRYAERNVNAIVGADARGFIFGGALAYAMELPFVPVRKKGKLPGKTLSEDFELEYGTDTIEIHADALCPGDRVVLIDDLLATGGTMAATAKLVRKLGAEIVEVAFVIELPPLKGREKLAGLPVHTLVQFMVE
ncbi:MAG TPA: adenine phosphoribosyltransferase [Candidatus Hydrogenedentes bacterium]|nr:adenine phosphoribosyltransferase [Candidatus Hydrogenedentota bacterium]HPG65724.1 adenine phosphoribosyltransferase [Candidatus Hydrogenedentota bacterium]